MPGEGRKGLDMAKKIAFINGKGGCGKTTSIFHIAGVLANAGDKVLVIDFDKQRNTTDTLLKNSEKPKKTVFDVMEGDFFENATAQALFVPLGHRNPRYFGVDCVASDIRLENEEELLRIDGSRFGERLNAFVEEMEYDWVLIDMPPSNRILNFICFGHVADFLIVPFSSDMFSLTGYGDILETVERARELNPSLNTLGVYLARYMANCMVDEYIRDELLGFDTFIDIQIPLAADVREAVMLGRPISYYKKTSKSRTAFEQLVKEIKIRISELGS